MPFHFHIENYYSAKNKADKSVEPRDGWLRLWGRSASRLTAFQIACATL
jgi:hypothetical protein